MNNNSKNQAGHRPPFYTQKEYAYYYHNLGLRIAPNTSQDVVNNITRDGVQTQQEIDKFNWEQTQGIIGFFSGKNNFRILTLCRFKLMSFEQFKNFVEAALLMLNLPIDYGWTIYSEQQNPSKCHIIFRTNEANATSNILRMTAQTNVIRLKTFEFSWYGNMMQLPCKIQDPQHKMSFFMSSPANEPEIVSCDSIETCLNVLLAGDQKVEYDNQRKSIKNKIGNFINLLVIAILLFLLAKCVGL